MEKLIPNQMDGGLNAKQTLLTEFSQNETGSQILPVFYDNVILDDISEKILSKRWTFERYAHYVATTPGTSYGGINKFLYEKTVDAVKTIIYCKKQKLRRRPELGEAIAFLHQDMKLSPNTIQQILLLFGVELTTSKILEASNKVFFTKPLPEWLWKLCRQEANELEVKLHA